MAGLVDRFDSDVARAGDKIHVPKITNLTAGNVGPDGSIVDSANTEGELTIDVDQWKYVSINIPDILKAQADYDLMQRYAQKMGFALGVVVEDKLLAHYDDLSTNSVGTAGTDITDANLRLAVQKLDDADAPFEDRHAIWKPAQKNALLGIDKFVRYDSIPFPKGESPVVKGNIGELYGVRMHVTTRVPTTSGETKNLMFQKSAFALAMQKDVSVEKLARTQLADRMVASELYGTAEMRDDHACKLKT